MRSLSGRFLSTCLRAGQLDGIKPFVLREVLNGVGVAGVGVKFSIFQTIAVVCSCPRRIGRNATKKRKKRRKTKKNKKMGRFLRPHLYQPHKKRVFLGHVSTRASWPSRIDAESQCQRKGCGGMSAERSYARKTFKSILNTV